MEGVHTLHTGLLFEGEPMRTWGSKDIYLERDHINWFRVCVSILWVVRFLSGHTAWV